MNLSEVWSLRSVRAVLLGTCALTAIIAIACIPQCDGIAFLYLPGVLFAAFIFPQGTEGDAPVAFMLLAAITDIAIFSGLAYLVVGQLERRRERNI